MKKKFVGLAKKTKKERRPQPLRRGHHSHQPPQTAVRTRCPELAFPGVVVKPNSAAVRLDEERLRLALRFIEA